MNEDDEMPLLVLSGRVKWFDPVKGFGFILSETTGSDVLLHANVLRNFGQNTVADGADITVKCQQTKRGVQAVEVVSITPPEGSGFLMAGESNTFSAEDIAACPMEPARVKWFDKGKGFGFANVFGRNEDVFVHVEVLRMSGFADLTAGEAICLRIIEGKRGRMAAQVLAWDSALREAK
ncbi:cold-shock DNA-binding protein family [Pseudorhodobacter antarcticus]|uniref:Cold-shock DNA-binding protein family n=1 Tax=Pseudorhodobacter antarcticus TaxID=1077947 RepID=A0A1H8DKU5_9RHOB|nr:cold shock domain-containing protein [Pseudorhodobacter antarcticus]SEN07157.1 cold-shock DNA-binding protein family [Pseudorhodobacter antarcticus]